MTARLLSSMCCSEQPWERSSLSEKRCGNMRGLACVQNVVEQEKPVTSTLSGGVNSSNCCCYCRQSCYYCDYSHTCHRATKSYSRSALFHLFLHVPFGMPWQSILWFIRVVVFFFAYGMWKNLKGLHAAKCTQTSIFHTSLNFIEVKMKLYGKPRCGLLILNCGSVLPHLFLFCF